MLSFNDTVEQLVDFLLEKEKEEKIDLNILSYYNPPTKKYLIECFTREDSIFENYKTILLSFKKINKINLLFDFLSKTKSLGYILVFNIIKGHYYFKEYEPLFKEHYHKFLSNNFDHILKKEEKSLIFKIVDQKDIINICENIFNKMILESMCYVVLGDLKNNNNYENQYKYVMAFYNDVPAGFAKLTKLKENKDYHLSYITVHSLFQGKNFGVQLKEFIFLKKELSIKPFDPKDSVHYSEHGLKSLSCQIKIFDKNDDLSQFNIKHKNFDDLIVIYLGKKQIGYWFLNKKNTDLGFFSNENLKQLNIIPGYEDLLKRDLNKIYLDYKNQKDI